MWIQQLLTNSPYYSHRLRKLSITEMERNFKKCTNETESCLRRSPVTNLAIYIIIIIFLNEIFQKIFPLDRKDIIFRYNMAID